MTEERLRRYTVSVSRTSTHTLDVVVIAPNEDEARVRAEAAAFNIDFRASGAGEHYSLYESHEVTFDGEVADEYQNLEDTENGEKKE